MPFREPYVFSWEDAGIVPNENIPPVVYGKALQTSDVYPYMRLSDEAPIIKPSTNYRGGSLIYKEEKPNSSLVKTVALALGMDWNKKIGTTDEPTKYLTTNAESVGYMHEQFAETWRIGFRRSPMSGIIQSLRISATDSDGINVPVSFVDAIFDNALYQGAPLVSDVKTEAANDYIKYSVIILGKIIVNFIRIKMTPVANTPVSRLWRFLDEYTALPVVLTTPDTTAPGTSVLGTSFSNPTTSETLLNLTRANTTTTWMNAVAIGI